MKNYQLQDIGRLVDVNQYVFMPQGTDIRIEGKLFLKDLLGLTSMEVSINKNAPGTGVNFFHRHKNHEELYIFLGGEGEMVIDDERFKVQEGTVVRIKPEAKRAWWNTGQSDLYYIVAQSENNALQSAALEDGEFLEGTVPWSK